MSSFVHLHVHTSYSFLDGTTFPQDLVKKAAALDMPAVAITDHNYVSGAVDFHKAAAAAGIKPIIGVEITLTTKHHLTLLAQNPQGYANICRLLTEAHLSSNRREPLVAPQLLSKYADNIIALSGCRRGEVPHYILQNRFDKAIAAASKYQEIFSHFYLELIDDKLPKTHWLNTVLVEIGRKLGIPVVATNNVHYLSRSQFPLHDALTAIRTNTTLEEVHPERKLNSENYFKSAQEMEADFAWCPEAIKNTLEIATMCEPALDLNRKLFPAFPTPPGMSADAFLRELTFAGANERYQKITPAIRQRLEHELSVISKLEVADYFLAVWDIARYAREQGIRYAGRGSAADSAVVYCLFITDVDAIGRGLLFERFLSLERSQRPDIDIDFDARYRDQVARYVYDTYGREYVASVCTFSTYQARSAIRDFGKVLGFPPDEIDRLAKLFPHIPADAIELAFEKYPEVRDSKLPRHKYELLFKLCAQAAALPRHIGTHLGGLIISREPLTTITPLQRAAKGVLITQFDKTTIEDLGVIKLDLLSLRTLSAVEDTMQSIQQSGHDVDYRQIPLDDKATYQRLNSGQTIGIFQLESPAQRALQSRLGADNIEDIVASVALIRPGPIQGNMVEPFLARRHGHEPVTYIHPKLEKILKKTYGVVLFQEQVIEIATEIAGFTPGESDRLRKAMTHFRSQKEMDNIGREFIAKAMANGIDQATAETIFSYIVGYAGYGFCEAHAAAFADTAYKTGYLLEHYPAHFFAALLNHQPMGFYPPNTLCLEARNRGVTILPLDINESEIDFTATDNTIRVGLKAVRGLSKQTQAAITAARAREGNFAGLRDFCLRVPIEKDELENLILGGAFDSLHRNRKQLLWEMESVWRDVKYKLQYSFFDIAPSFASSLYRQYEIPDFSEIEKFLAEYKVLGFHHCKHLMEFYRPQLEKKHYLSSKDVKNTAPGSTVTTAGIVIRPHRPPTKSGRVVVFLSLEDEFGLIDVTVFENVYHRYGRTIFTQPALVVTGKVEERGNVRNITAKKITPLFSLAR